MRTLTLMSAFALVAACSTGTTVEADDDEAEQEPEQTTRTGQETEQEQPGQTAGAEQEVDWVEQAPLPEERTEVSATTDGERVFLAGGFGPPEGDERATAPRAMWAYSPDDEAWEQIGELPHGVHHAAFVYHNDKLYILGGFRETTFEPVDNVHIFDLEAEEWQDGEPMPTPRGAAGFTVMNERIHVIGGNVASEEDVAGIEGVESPEDNSVNVHEAYDPQTDTWMELAPMPTARNHLGAASHNGRIHAVLGRVNDEEYRMTDHEIYDAEADSWQEGPQVPTGRSGVAVLEQDGYIYAFGGEDLSEGQEQVFDAAERFDIEEERWEELEPMPTARHGLGAAAIGDSIYVVSGGPGPAFHFGDANERLDVSGR